MHHRFVSNELSLKKATCYNAMDDSNQLLTILPLENYVFQHCSRKKHKKQKLLFILVNGNQLIYVLKSPYIWINKFSNE